MASKGEAMLAKVGRVLIKDANAPVRVTGSIPLQRDGFGQISTLDPSFIWIRKKIFYTNSTRSLLEGVEFADPYKITGMLRTKGLSEQPVGSLPIVLLVMVPVISLNGSAWYTTNFRKCIYQSQPERKLRYGSFCPECGMKLAGWVHPPTPDSMVPESIYPTNNSGIAILEQGFKEIAANRAVEYILLYIPVGSGIYGNGVRVDTMTLTEDQDHSDQRNYFSCTMKWDGERLEVQLANHIPFSVNI